MSRERRDLFLDIVTGALMFIVGMLAVRAILAVLG